MGPQFNLAAMIRQSYSRCTDKFAHETQSYPDPTVKATHRLNFRPFDTRKNQHETHQPKYRTYQEYFHDNRNTSLLVKPSDLPEDLYTIRRHLDYLSMAPTNASLHKQTYVIDKGCSQYTSSVEMEKALTAYDNMTLNENSGTLDQFFSFWTTKARDLLKTYDLHLSPNEHDSIRNLCKFLIVAPPGTGKTALLNYLFSTNAKTMIKDRIFWVRVDLNNPRSFYLSLGQRLNAKFLRIFASCYLLNDSHPEFGSSFLKSLQTYLEEYVKETPLYAFNTPVPVEKVVERFITLMLALVGVTVGDNDDPIQYQAYELDLVQANDLIDQVLLYTQEKHNFAYIFVFDGLDSVTIDLVQYKVYSDWLNQIYQVSDNYKKKYKAVYIVTMRDYSYIKYFAKVMSEEKEYGDYTSSFKTLNILTYPTATVLNAKFRLIQKTLLQSKSTISQQALENVKMNLLAIVYSSYFDIHLEEDHSPLSQEEILSKMDSLFVRNYRAIMRFLRELILIIYSVLKQEAFSLLTSSPEHKVFWRAFAGNEWMIYRLMLYGDIGRDVYRNRVQYLETETMITMQNRAIVPNIFNYYEHDINGKLSKNLVKLRILQYLRKNPDSTIQSAIEWLNTEIDPNWSTDSLKHETREMIYNFLVYPLADNFTIAVHGDSAKISYYVEISRLCGVIESMLDKSIYYETVIDDTPIDTRYSHFMHPLNRLDASLSREEYIMQKTRSVLFFLLYLMKVESDEKKRLREITGMSNEEYESSFQIFTNERVEKILATIEQYVRGFSKSLKTKQSYSDFVERWYEYFDVPKATREIMRD